MDNLRLAVKLDRKFKGNSKSMMKQKRWARLSVYCFII